MAATDNPMWTIGRNGQAVITDNGSNIQLEEVTNISTTALYNRVAASPLRSPPRSYSVPNGWQGSLTIVRASRDFDNWMQSKEDQFWAAGTISTGTLTLYVDEADGTTSKWLFENVSYEGQPGSFDNDNPVMQTLSFTASRRTKLG